MQIPCNFPVNLIWFDLIYFPPICLFIHLFHSVYKFWFQNTLWSDLFPCNWIGFVANSMQLFHFISICEIKCYKKHIKSNTLRFIGKEIRLNKIILCHEIYLSSWGQQGKNVNDLIWDFWGENEICEERNGQSFIPIPEIGRGLVKFGKLIQVTFGHCPFDWSLLDQGYHHDQIMLVCQENI